MTEVEPTIVRCAMQYMSTSTGHAAASAHVRAPWIAAVKANAFAHRSRRLGDDST